MYYFYNLKFLLYRITFIIMCNKNLNVEHIIKNFDFN